MGKEEEILILSEHVLLLLGTQNMHLRKKYPPRDLNTPVPLLLLLPLKPQSRISVVKNVKQRITSVGGMASAGGLIRKEMLLPGILLLVL